MSMLAAIGAVFSVDVLASGLRLAVPTALAALGESISQRAGIFNLGLEGMMMVGAFAGFAATSATGSASLGIGCAAAAGAALALLMVFGSVLNETNIIVTGFSLVLLGQGLGNFLYAQNQNRLPTFGPLDEIDTGRAADIPLLGPTLFSQNAFFYLTIAFAILIAALLGRTRFGLEVAATGSDRDAATAKGVRVRRIQTLAVLAAGTFAGIGGAAITIGSVGNFGSNITAGKGFVAISLVAVARTRIGWVLLAAVAFGTLEAAEARLEGVAHVPTELLPALPWIAVVLALVALAFSRPVRLRRAA
jgi:general nucleoside transport system permease protein